ncbi:MAG: tetratricopeptide repeat protein [Saprospiraceae bacterium]|nr:tetratricopeptide repeat protein [Saprospiraceae bacterium]
MAKKQKEKPKARVLKHQQKQAISTSFWKQPSIWVPGLVVMVLSFIFFSPSLNNQFVNWDDDVNILENKNTAQLTSENVKRIFSIEDGHVIGNYNPLPILTFAIERHYVGLDPYLFHLNNLILHLLCIFMVYRIGLLLGLNMYSAVLLAALFGFHPMRVESVAWITERKDVLFGLFFLASLFYYIKYQTEKKSIWNLSLVFVFFILSLFSKIQAVTLPLTMLAVDYLLKRPLKLNLIWEKIPYFALSLTFGLIGVYSLALNESLDQTQTNYNILQRLCIGAYSYTTYLYKVVFPHPMVPLYPYPKNIPWYIYASMAPALAVLYGMYVAYKKDLRVIVFGWAVFTFNVMFLLQIVGAGQGFIADRFTYIPYLGLFFIAAYYFQQFLINKPASKTVAMMGMSGILLVYGIITWNQNKIWFNGETLWTHVLKYNTNITLPYGNRANFRRDNKDFVRALEDYNASIALDPNKATVYNSRGRMYFDQQQFEAAKADYDKAISLDTTKGEFYTNRAAALASLNRFQEALMDSNKGLELDPEFSNGYMNRFLILQALNQFEESLKDLEWLIARSPGEANLQYEKARALRILGRTQESMQWYDKAIQLNPNQGLFYAERGRTNLDLNNKAAAKADFDRATQLGQQVDPALIERAR